MDVVPGLSFQPSKLTAATQDLTDGLRMVSCCSLGKPMVSFPAKIARYASECPQCDATDYVLLRWGNAVLQTLHSPIERRRFDSVVLRREYLLLRNDNYPAH